MRHVLLLGGTTEASRLAHALAAARVSAVYSYAGRTDAPVPQPVPTRIGGFGGVQGLIDYMADAGVTHVVDATHPFASRISSNAIAACGATGIPLCALERAPWVAGPGDDWRLVADIAGALAALPETPARVFLAIGKQNLSAFAVRPQHHYLVRLVDPPEGLLPLPDVHAVIARGPFDLPGDLALLQTHRITHIVAKNAGGSGAEAKLKAARILQIPVVLIDRPPLLPRRVFDQVDEVMGWLADHPACLGL